MGYIFSFVVLSLVGILISIGDDAREECIKRERDKIWRRDTSCSAVKVEERQVGTMTIFETYVIKVIIYLVWIAAFICIGIALYLWLC